MRRLLACLLLPLAATPALACSDLPNICEQQAAAHEQNVEMGRQAAEAYAQ
jgi:hypothetical protein